MKSWTVLLAVALVACSGSSTPAPTSKPEASAKKEGEAKEGKGKKGKKAAGEPAAPGGEGEGDEKGEKEDVNAAPILRTGRFRVPLKDLPETDVAAVRAAMVAAWEKAGKEEGAEPPKADDAPKAWKCRHATVWETTGAAAPQLRLFERLSDVDCKKAEAKEERWELSLRYQTPAKPEKKDLGGKLKYLMASTDLDWDAGKYAESFGTVYRLEGGDQDAGFPHDDAWVKEQIPAGVTVGAKKVELDSWRWAIGTVVIGGEKVTVEAERWNCRDGKASGAELVFRTNKRAPGHTSQSPKDVVITDKIKAFAEAFVKELGDKVGGKGAVSESALSCGG